MLLQVVLHCPLVKVVALLLSQFTALVVDIGPKRDTLNLFLALNLPQLILVIGIPFCIAIHMVYSIHSIRISTQIFVYLSALLSDFGLEDVIFRFLF